MMKKLINVSMLVMLLSIGNLATASIGILNPSFEDAAMADNSWDGAATGWVENADGDVHNFMDAQFAGATDDGNDDNLVIPVGSNVMVLAGGSGKYVLQELGTTYAEGVTYELSAWFGARGDEAPGYATSAELFFFDNDTSTIVASTIVPLGDADRGNFRQETVLFTAPAALDGKAIVIGAQNLGPAWQVSVDNFALVPEPATIIMLGIGGIAALRRRKSV
jgi:hypothetical protein